MTNNSSTIAEQDSFPGALHDHGLSWHLYSHVNCSGNDGHTDL